MEPPSDRPPIEGRPPRQRRTKRQVFWVVPVALIVGALAWLMLAFTASLRIVTPQNESHTEKLRTASFLAFRGVSRVEERGGGNVRVYFSKSTYEAIPFPDRRESALLLCRVWCPSVSKHFLPTVAIHDIRTGKKLDKCSCTSLLFSPSVAGDPVSEFRERRFEVGNVYRFRNVEGKVIYTVRVTSTGWERVE